MSETTTTNTASEENVAKQLKSLGGSADSAVTQRTQTLGLVHQARLSRANRTAASLTAQFGADDPRVVEAQARVTVTKATIAKISASNQNLSMPVAQASPSGWVIQGYVRDINLNPLPKLTVYLADSNTMFQSEYGINYTDDSGYYSIEYAGTGDKADPDAKVPTLYVALINPRGNPAYITPKPVSLSFGATTVLDISLTSVDQTIGDPDKQIRQLALPNEQVATAPST